MNDCESDFVSTMFDYESPLFCIGLGMRFEWKDHNAIK